MAVVTQNVNVDNNAGLSAIGTGIAGGLCCIGTGISTGQASIAAAHTAAATTHAAAQQAIAATQAAAYTGESAAGWVQKLLVPGVVLLAQLALIEKQKADYKEIAQEQRDLLDTAVDNYTSCVEAVEGDFIDSYPGVPNAAQYIPVDDCALQAATIACNRLNLTDANSYAEKTREYHQAVEVARLTTLNMQWVSDMLPYQQSIRDLLNGRLPVDEVADIISDVGEQACLRGQIGGTCRETIRSLGVSRLRAQEAGRRGMDQWLQSMNQNVSPLAKLVDMREMMQSPAQRIALALTQAQLIQNSLQNVYNLGAQVPLGKTALIQAKIQKCITVMSGEMSKANLVNTYVPNYAAALQPGINSLANSIGSLISGTGNAGGNLGNGTGSYGGGYYGGQTYGGTVHNLSDGSPSSL